MAPTSRKPGGFTVKSFQGMSKKRMASPANKAWGMRLPIKKGTTFPIQFLQTPEEATEFEVHAFQEGGRWEFVPCAGESCPLCSSPNERQARVSYRFAVNVYNLEAKKVQVLEGGSNLAQVVYYKYERGPERFLKRTWDVTMLPTQPVSFQLERGEEEVVNTRTLKHIDLNDYLIQSMKDYYGDEMPTADSLFEGGDEDEEGADDDEDFDDDATGLEDEEDEETDPAPVPKKKSTKTKTTRK